MIYHRPRKRKKDQGPVVVREFPARNAAEWGMSTYVTWKNAQGK